VRRIVTEPRFRTTFVLNGMVLLSGGWEPGSSPF
jgi:hypothetical protein